MYRVSRIIDGLKFHAEEDFATNSIGLHLYVRHVDGISFVTDATITKHEFGAATPLPTFALTHEQAAALYEELGRVLGRLDSATLESVVEAQSKHLADLREITFRVVKG